MKLMKWSGLSLSVMLAGCSGAPSADDIKAAWQEHYSGDTTVEKITDVTCKEAVGKPGYVCSYNGVARLLGNLRIRIPEARFVQIGSKWSAVND